VIKKLEGHTGWVRSVAFSPCGKYVVSGSYDKSVFIWDVQNGTVIKKLEGHTGWVRSVAFSPCGKYVVSGSYDKCVLVWDVDSGEVVEQDFSLSAITGHGTAARSLDGRYTAHPSGCTVIVAQVNSDERARIIWRSHLPTHLTAFKCQFQEAIGLTQASIRLLESLQDGAQ